MPRVSVVVVTYCRVEALKRTPESFRGHADVPYELIICDDAQSGRPVSADRRLGADVHIWNDLVGYGANANSGMAAARCDYIFHLKDDLIVAERVHFLAAGVDVQHVNRGRGPRIAWISDCLAFSHHRARVRFEHRGATEDASGPARRIGAVVPPSPSAPAAEPRTFISPTSASKLLGDLPP